MDIRYIVSSEETQLSLYYEPHCSYDPSLLNEYRADVVITPVVKQLLPSFTLVSGQEDAVELAKLLGAKYIDRSHQILHPQYLRGLLMIYE